MKVQMSHAGNVQWRPKDIWGGGIGMNHLSDSIFRACTLQTEVYEGALFNFEKKFPNRTTVKE